MAKKKRTDGITEIVVVLDRSGSMSAVREDMVGGLNRFVKDQKKLPDKARFTLVQFDTEYETVCDGMDLGKVGTLDLVPRGCTALLDAIGRTIHLTDDRLTKLTSKAKPSKVLFLIITDGHENSSHEFTKKQILEMIKQQKDKNKWEFVFLGANQNAIDEGAQIGIGVAQSMTYAPTKKGIGSAFASLSTNTSNYRATGSYSFSAADRKKQEDA